MTDPYSPPPPARWRSSSLCLFRVAPSKVQYQNKVAPGSPLFNIYSSTKRQRRYNHSTTTSSSPQTKADVICFVTTNVSAINHPGIWQWCIARGVAVIAGATIGYVCLKYSILRETWSWGPGSEQAYADELMGFPDWGQRLDEALLRPISECT
jgi:hypothetical protein